MKNVTLTMVVILVIAIIVFAGIIKFNIPHIEDFASNEGEDIIMGEPFKHKEHTHDHKGLACCPCGACHMKLEEKKKEGEKGEKHEHEPLEIPSIFRVISLITIIAVIFASLSV